MLLKNSVASFQLDTNLSADQLIVMKLIFVNLYNMDLKFDLTTQSIFREIMQLLVIYYMYQNRFGRNRKKYRHKHKELPGIAMKK